MSGRTDETRDGVGLTHLDQPLLAGGEATKRELVDYLDQAADWILPGLRGRPLSVIRATGGQRPFMQKNLPAYAPDWIARDTIWAPSARREVTYALCDDRRTLLWFANQRAIEYHPTIVTAAHPDRPTYLVMDIDPPEGGGFGQAVGAARTVRRALADAGLTGLVKTSGSKGVHIMVPLAEGTGADDAAAATRAVAARAERLDPEHTTTAFIKDERQGKVFLDSTRAGGATVVAVYSPRVRPGLTVSFPVEWDDLDEITPADFTIHTAPALLRGTTPWPDRMPAPQVLPAELVAEGRAIPAARAQALQRGRSGHR